GKAGGFLMARIAWPCPPTLTAAGPRRQPGGLGQAGGRVGGWAAGHTPCGGRWQNGGAAGQGLVSLPLPPGPHSATPAPGSGRIPPACPPRTGQAGPAPKPYLTLAQCLAPLLLVTGCAGWQGTRPTPPEIGPAAVAARLLVPAGLDVNPAETVVKPAAPGQASLGPPVADNPELQPPTFALADALAFALRNNPRLRSARAAIERARGQEQVAFAPFLPQIDLLGQSGVVSATLAPGVPGNEGFILADGFGTRTYAQAEVGLQWTLYDFGRTGGRYRP